MTDRIDQIYRRDPERRMHPLAWRNPFGHLPPTEEEREAEAAAARERTTRWHGMRKARREYEKVDFSGK